MEQIYRTPMPKSAISIFIDYENKWKARYNHNLIVVDTGTKKERCLNRTLKLIRRNLGL